MLKSFLIKIIAIAIGAALLFRLININEGISVSLLSRKAPDVKLLSKIIKLNPRHAYAYSQLAWLEFQKGHYSTAKKNAHQALNHNLSDGLAMTILMSIYDREKKPELANQAAQLAERLWPAHDTSMRLISHHWVREKNIEKAMSAWNVILNQDPFDEEMFFNGWAAKNLFPILNNIAQAKASTQLFQPYHTDPPLWWDRFFEYLSKQPNNLKAVNRFYQQMQANGKVSIKSNKLFLANLIHENEWPKAKSLWVKGLSGKNKQYSDLIYDGSFESSVMNEYFSWIAAPKTYVNVFRDKNSKTDGNYSMHIEFTSTIDDYWGWFRQILSLKPGKYSITYQTRARLKSYKGLMWRVACMEKPRGKILTLADGPAIKGNFEWRKETFTVNIPNSKTCRAQNLHLIPAGSSSLENRMQGDVWFDDFKIMPVR